MKFVWQISRPPCEWCEFGQGFYGQLDHLYYFQDFRCHFSAIIHQNDILSYKEYFYINIKVEVNFIKFCTVAFIACLGILKLEYSKVGLKILQHSTLFSFHIVLHEWDSIKGNKVVTFITCFILHASICVYNPSNGDIIDQNNGMLRHSLATLKGE